MKKRSKDKIKCCGGREEESLRDESSTEERYCLLELGLSP